MKRTNLLYLMVAVGAIAGLSSTIASPVAAQAAKATTKPEKCACGKVKGTCAECKSKGGDHHGTKDKVISAKTKKVAATMYQCQHCKEPMSLAAAKKKGMHCCGMSMVAVKSAKKSDASKKG